VREQLANKYIRGRGIEIGGLHNPLSVPLGALVSYVDRYSLGTLNTVSDVRPVQNELIVDDAERLDHFKDDSLDFIIGNHVLEHCHDFIGTLYRWYNVLTKEGIIYAAIPDKDFTFDKPRKVTPLAHLIRDYEVGYEQNDPEHYREWHYEVDNLRGQELEDRVKLDIELRANIHFHVWDRKAQIELIDYFKTMFEVLENPQHGAEIIWILRKK
jgi:SAM-dependent methyltransferase